MASDPPNEEKTDNWNILWSAFSEFLFLLLPLIVISIVMLHKGYNFWQILSSPEWSFGSAIMYGYSVVKFVSGASSTGDYIWEIVALVVAVIIVLLLVPSLIILSLILVSDNPSNGLVWSQIVLFVIACLVFLYIGGFGYSDVLKHSK